MIKKLKTGKGQAKIKTQLHIKHEWYQFYITLTMCFASPIHHHVKITRHKSFVTNYHRQIFICNLSICFVCLYVSGCF